MSEETRAVTVRKLTRKEQRQVDAKTRLSSPAASAIAIVVAILWTTPTAGLLITSFRQQIDISKSGWWTAFATPDFTLDNYAEALDTHNLGMSFINSFIITIPAVVIPIILACWRLTRSRGSTSRGATSCSPSCLRCRWCRSRSRWCRC